MTYQINAKKAVFIPDKAGFQARKITRNNKGHYITIKGSIR